MPMWPLLLLHRFAYSSLTPGHNECKMLPKWHCSCVHFSLCYLWDFSYVTAIFTAVRTGLLCWAEHIFLQFSSKYVSLCTPLCTSSTWVCILFFFSHCCRMYMRPSYPCALLWCAFLMPPFFFPSCLSLKQNLCSLFEALRSHSKCSGCHFEIMQSGICVIERSIQRTKVDLPVTKLFENIFSLYILQQQRWFNVYHFLLHPSAHRSFIPLFTTIYHPLLPSFASVNGIS